jgi:hypothetical protein
VIGVLGDCKFLFFFFFFLPQNDFFPCMFIFMVELF